MHLSENYTRRTALTALASVSGAALLGGAASTQETSAQARPDASAPGSLRQSVSRWCYGKVPLDVLCQAANDMGIQGIDLLGENDWPVVKAQGLECAMASGLGNIPAGWNRPENQERLIVIAQELLPKIAQAGIKNVVIFSGNREGLPDSEGITNCARGLEKILPLAESLGVVLCMELLNSKRDHKDYQCDHTAWGVELAKLLGSEHFKLLYDIYHMQIMEGDVIATIQENIPYIGHFHTGGVPGRNEIDDTQELNYRRICQVIADTGFDGFIGHEFVPKADDPMASLRDAVAICTV
ncbi:MAG: TIM barrel protein [Candidatus Hydrogenedentes bacterium]|nr:TIM barrel protein [Candidatus Hydrogenedentota bacterium]